MDVLDQFLVKISDRVVSALNEEESLNTGGFPVSFFVTRKTLNNGY